jgi:hypothetical protein
MASDSRRTPCWASGFVEPEPLLVDVCEQLPGIN